MPNHSSYRNDTNIFGMASTSPFQPQAPQGPPGPLEAPYGPQMAHMGPKNLKIITFGPTIKCHTIFQLKMLPEIQWAYTFTGPPEPCMGPQS